MNTSHITGEQWEAAEDVYDNHSGCILESLKAAVATLPEPPQSPPMLLPITDKMPPVAEGCKRLHAILQKDGSFGPLTSYRSTYDNHFLDIQLPLAPDPLAQKREAFEKIMREKMPKYDLTREGDGYRYGAQTLWEFYHTTN